MKCVREKAAAEAKPEFALLGNDDSAKNLVFDHVAKYVTCKLYSSIFPFMSTDADITLHEKAQALQNAGMAHFGVKSESVDDSIWMMAVERTHTLTHA